VGPFGGGGGSCFGGGSLGSGVLPGGGGRGSPFSFPFVSLGVFGGGITFFDLLGTFDMTFFGLPFGPFFCAYPLAPAFPPLLNGVGMKVEEEVGVEVGSKVELL